MLVTSLIYFGTALGLMTFPFNIAGLIGAFLILIFKKGEYRIPIAVSFSMLCTLFSGIKSVYIMMFARLLEEGIPVQSAQQASITYAGQNGLLIPLIIAATLFSLSWKFRLKKGAWLIIPLAAISLNLFFGALHIELSHKA